MTVQNITNICLLSPTPSSTMVVGSLTSDRTNLVAIVNRISLTNNYNIKLNILIKYWLNIEIKYNSSNVYMITKDIT